MALSLSTGAGAAASSAGAGAFASPGGAAFSPPPPLLLPAIIPPTVDAFFAFEPGAAGWRRTLDGGGADASGAVKLYTVSEQWGTDLMAYASKHARQLAAEPALLREL